MKDILSNSNTAIVGGGRVCKAFLETVQGRHSASRKLNIIGVADINNKAEGLVFAKLKGIFTTTDFRDLLTIRGLNLIIELTGDNRVLGELKSTKPEQVRLIDHFEAMSVWDFLQIEEAKEKVKEKIRKYVTESDKIEREFDFFSNHLSKIVEERTEHLQTVEKELVERQRDLSQIVQGSTLPTFVINKEHIVTHWNIACEKLTGYKADEIVGTDKHWKPFRQKKRPLMADVIVDQLGEEEIRKYYGNEWRKSALIEGAYQAEQFFPQIGGESKWLLFTAAPIRGAGGDITGSIQTLWDITERKKSQEALQKAHDELEARVEKRTTELTEVNE